MTPDVTPQPDPPFQPEPCRKTFERNLERLCQLRFAGKWPRAYAAYEKLDGLSSGAGKGVFSRWKPQKEVEEPGTESARNPDALPDGKTLRRMCQVFRCSLEELFASEKIARSVVTYDQILEQVKADADLYLVVDDDNFHSTAEETVDNFKGLYERALHQRPELRMTILCPFPRRIGATTEARGNTVLERLKRYKKDLGSQLRYLFFDPLLAGVDACCGMLLFVNPGKPEGWLLQEIRCELPMEDSQSLWMRIHVEDCKRRWERICSSVIPAINPAWWNHLTRVGFRDRLQWMDRGMMERYVKMRDLVKPGEDFEEIRRALIDDVLGTQKVDHLQVLEVGPADYLKSWDTLYKDKGDRQIHVTGLDPMMHKIAGLAAGVHPVTLPDSIEEHFPTSTLYDVVFIAHALYRSDPSVLAKTIGMLRVGGYLVVLHSMMKDSFVFRLAQGLDRWIDPAGDGERQRMLDEAALRDPKNAFRAESPLRIAAEELERWFQDNGWTQSDVPSDAGPPRYQKSELTSIVSRGALLEGDGLTQGGRAMVEYLRGPRNHDGWFERWLGDKAGKDFLNELRSAPERLEHRVMLLWARRVGTTKSWLSRKNKNLREYDIPQAVDEAKLFGKLPLGE